MQSNPNNPITLEDHITTLEDTQAKKQQMMKQPEKSKNKKKEFKKCSVKKQ